MFDKIPVFIDIETNIPDEAVFKAYGQLAMTEIKAFCIASQGNTWSTAMRLAHTFAETFNALRLHPDTHAIVGHNIIRFDLPIIKRLTGLDLLEKYDIYDTLLMSKISEFKRSTHSLESYASESGYEKLPLDNTDHRCINDVLITQWLFEKLLVSKKNLGIPDNPYKVEFRVAEIIARQTEHGIGFDRHNAQRLRSLIEARMSDLNTHATHHIPYQRVKNPKMPPKIQFKKNGDISAAFNDYLLDNDGVIVQDMATGEKFVQKFGSTDKYTLPLTVPLKTHEPLNLGSSDQVKEWLLREGWKPTLWNYKKDATGKPIKTSPRLYDENKELCPHLAEMKIPGVDLISEFLNLRNRLGIIKGWLDDPRCQGSSVLTPDADTCGAVTHRFTHRIVANVPRKTSKFGAEIRALFRPRNSDKLMVGWDAKALEAVMEAHYTFPYDSLYASTLLEGDIHTRNMEMLKLPSRDKAKTFKYAITYGAGPSKLARTFGWTVAEATRYYDAFWDGNTALRLLRDECKKSTAVGYIRGLDGRPIAVNSEHSALNRLLQSAGAIVMKYAMVLADRDIRRAGLDAVGVIRYHDEEQWESNHRSAHKVGEIGVESIRKAARYLKLNVPLDGEYKIGHNWSETH